MDDRPVIPGCGSYKRTIGCGTDDRRPVIPGCGSDTRTIGDRYPRMRFGQTRDPGRGPGSRVLVRSTRISVPSGVNLMAVAVPVTVAGSVALVTAVAVTVVAAIAF